jgi:UDP-glucose 4-epimerase
MTQPLVLVTGARGYVGGRLVAHLREEGNYRVRTGSRVVLPGAQGEAAPIGELSDDTQLEKACEGAACVVHLAALNEIDSEREPERAIDVNVTGTLRLARAAKRMGVRRFVYISTAHVYGAPLAGRIDETTVTWPVHPYAITHRAAEDFVFAECVGSQVEAVVLRLSNAVGAPADPAVQRWSLLVNDLCRQVVTTGRIVLRSAGLAQRDFIAMSDACRAVSHFLELPTERLPAGPLNLGGGRSWRIIDVVELVADRCAALLAFRPVIDRPTPSAAESAPKLDYRIDRLLATGFELRGDLSQEIDATLQLCVEAFSSGAGPGVPRSVGGRT